MKNAQNIIVVINLKHLGEREFGQTSFGYLTQFKKMMHLKVLPKTDLPFFILLFLTSPPAISPVNQEVPWVKFNERRKKILLTQISPRHFHVPWQTVHFIL